ncbi:unnamed protein product [Vitrella brassicaformis CCMP3155]|uniref:Uncharacterized protein n=1 Tax=Vitrella brassicaformis (strain CCMP3155) TaxID=1169540 RepID=A0A0G4F3F7_VITBC|nr:unnamed protein product [Vitrella brassicaformis CCMP3155]|eukprot:CEM06597.1 unnamed protein product [Vitrella brassicaformis CCMP3155]
MQLFHAAKSAIFAKRETSATFEKTQPPHRSVTEGFSTSRPSALHANEVSTLVVATAPDDPTQVVVHRVEIGPTADSPGAADIATEEVIQRRRSTPTAEPSPLIIDSQLSRSAPRLFASATGPVMVRDTAKEHAERKERSPPGSNSVMESPGVLEPAVPPPYDTQLSAYTTLSFERGPPPTRMTTTAHRGSDMRGSPAVSTFTTPKGAYHPKLSVSRFRESQEELLDTAVPAGKGENTPFVQTEEKEDDEVVKSFELAKTSGERVKVLMGRDEITFQEMPTDATQTKK